MQEHFYCMLKWSSQSLSVASHIAEEFRYTYQHDMNNFGLITPNWVTWPEVDQKPKTPDDITP